MSSVREWEYDPWFSNFGVAIGQGDEQKIVFMSKYAKLKQAYMFQLTLMPVQRCQTMLLQLPTDDVK